MSTAIDTAFNTPGIEIRPPRFNCPTGNCTWPTYSTLGVCHQCQDVSYLLQYICKNNTSLNSPSGELESTSPCGFKVNNTFIAGWSGSPGFRQVTSLSTIIVDTFESPPEFAPFFNSTSFSNATLPIADFYVGFTPGGPSAVLRNQTPVLVECLLTWCAKTLETQFSNGLLQENVVNTVTIQPGTRDENGSTESIASLGSNSTFEILNQTTQLLRDWILNDLPPYLYQDPDFDFVSSAGIWQFHQEAPYAFEPHLDDITRAITNDMKSRAAGTTPIIGTAWEIERFVSIRWAWITLPVASHTGSLILIWATIWKSHKSDARVWKSSSLAILLHGLSEETQQCIDSTSSSSQVEAIAAKMNVQLSSRKGMLVWSRHER